MKNELLGWMKLLRYFALWCGFWWVISTSLTDFAQWSAMPQGVVLTIIIGVISFWVTRTSVPYIERKFFGFSPMYDTDLNGVPVRRAQKSTSSSNAARNDARYDARYDARREPVVRIRSYYTDPMTGRRTRIYDSHPALPEPAPSYPAEEPPYWDGEV